MRSSRLSRLLRALAASSVATFVALMSHVAGGGQVPGLLGLVVPWVLSLAVCTVLAGRRLSLWRLSISVAVSQLLFHTLFVLGAASSATMTVSDHTGHGEHSMMAMTASTGADTAHMLSAHPMMWFWHGVAAVITVAALYRGERALSRMRELAVQMVVWVRRRLDAATVPALVVAAVLAVSNGSERLLVPGPQLSSLRRRGPPLLRVI